MVVNSNINIYFKYESIYKVYILGKFYEHFKG